MDTQVYDAHGTNMAEMGTCFRCGSTIKNICWFRGQSYGTDCIEVVTGQRLDQWVVKNGVIDETVTAQRKAERTAKSARNQEAETTRKAEAAREREAALVENDWLLSVLRDEFQSDFIRSMVSFVESAPLKERVLSQRQFDALCDIYAKSFGRRGSKKNEAAVDKFYAKMGVE